MSRQIVALALCLCPLFTVAQEPTADKWDKELAAIDARDAKEMPAKGGVLFVGSSSIRLWDLKKSFPDLAAVNHGFGGSQIADSVTHFQRLVTPLAPKMIVFYAGDNDLASGKTPEQVEQDFREFHALVRKTLPESRLAFIAIKPSPSRWKLIDKQRDANGRIKRFLAPDSLAIFVDVEPPMLDADGQPRAELYRDDKLHLTEKGYAVWSSVLSPLFK